MNLSVLERMASGGDISKDALLYLLNCHCESERLDYKEALHLGNDEQLCAFAKDVLAVKNIGGGYLLVGVRDKTWQPIGLQNPLPYDSKLLRDKIRKSAGVELDVDIVHHQLSVTNSTGLFALILVRSSRKRKRRRVPTVCSKDCCYKKPYGLRRGDIFVRRVDETIRVQSEGELAALLDELEAQADQDALEAAGSPSAFAIEDGTYRLLEKGFDSFIGRDSLRSEVLRSVTRDPRIWIINVHGPGGVGKSALVNWVVHEFYRQRTFEAIVQLTAKESVLTPRGIIRFGRSLYSLENLFDHILGVFQEHPADDLDVNRVTVTELLSAWSTLLVLDNMETVHDGRILDFVQKLPVDSRAKVLMTSRQKTGAWELPIPVTELSVQEVGEFVRTRSVEMGSDFPRDAKTIDRIWQASGGLPLAIQWILGRYRLGGRLDNILDAVVNRDSAVLEFSFRNIWGVLSPDAKAVLAAMSIFQEPPTSQQVAIATAFDIDTVEKAFAELSEVTFVTRNTQQSDGRARFVALPITLSFAQHQLAGMGDFEVECRQRHNKYTEQMQLQESEVFRFRNEFERYGIETENEKRAAILCQRGKSEMFAGNVENADLLFSQARDLAPQCAYVHAMSASYNLARNNIGVALRQIEEACGRATKKTGALCYNIKARICDAERDRYGRVRALARAVEYDPDDMVTRHQYGVALSRTGNEEDAIAQFDVIVEQERKMSPPTVTLMMALKTRMINNRRLGRSTDVTRDLHLVDELLRKHPTLGSAADFSEFRDDPPGGGE